MLTLFHSPKSRSSRFIWLLEELRADYKIEYVTIARMDGSGGRDPKNPHPYGQVPALDHNGEIITESGAIALYLTDLLDRATISYGASEVGRGTYLAWLFWYANELEPTVGRRFSNAELGDPQAEKIGARVDEKLNLALREGPYLMGERFTAADILVGSAFMWAPHVLPQGPWAEAYVARLMARPALQQAMARDEAKADQMASA